MLSLVETENLLIDCDNVLPSGNWWKIVKIWKEIAVELWEVRVRGQYWMTY